MIKNIVFYNYFSNFKSPLKYYALLKHVLLVAKQCNFAITYFFVEVLYKLLTAFLNLNKVLFFFQQGIHLVFILIAISYALVPEVTILVTLFKLLKLMSQIQETSKPSAILSFNTNNKSFFHHHLHLIYEDLHYFQ